MSTQTTPDMDVESPVDEFSPQVTCPPEGLHVIAYPAMLDVPRELVDFTSGLLHTERVARGTRAPTSTKPSNRAADMAYVILDGKVFSADLSAEKTTSVKGDQIDLWYSGKAREQGGNIQTLSSPTGIPLWVSDVEPGSVHDLTTTQEHHSAVCTGLPYISNSPRSPTEATRELESMSTPR